MSVGYKPAGGGLKQFNWDISIEYKRDKDNVMKLLTMTVDVAGSLFERGIGGRRLRSPRHRSLL
jgi:hypothetical protein